MSRRLRISEILLSATQAKHLLHDSDALQEKEAESPPSELSLSMSVEGIPDWASSKATVIPEIPPPMIRTSAPDGRSFFSVNSLRLIRFGFSKAPPFLAKGEGQSGGKDLERNLQSFGFWRPKHMSAFNFIQATISRN